VPVNILYRNSFHFKSTDLASIALLLDHPQSCVLRDATETPIVYGTTTLAGFFSISISSTRSIFKVEACDVSYKTQKHFIVTRNG